MADRKSLTAERLRAALSYDPDTGIFTNRVKRSISAPAGAIAGRRDPGRYTDIGFDGVLYKGARLAFLYQTGEWPAGVVDHIDHDISNDRWSNLRDVSRHVNQQNQVVAPCSNTHGWMGVTKKKNGRWGAQISISGKKIDLGRFGTPESAHEAYLAAKRELHPGNTL
jgi:hypothetical protein